MNYVIGATLFLLGGAVAYFAAGRSDAGWITVTVMAALWLLFILYLIGVQHGKRNSDL